MNIYCIGCRHLRYTQKRIGSYSSWTGPWTASDASLSCEKDHWKLYLESGPVGGLDLENAMRHAATCLDYEERVEPGKGE